MSTLASSNGTNSSDPLDPTNIFNGDAGVAQNASGIATKAFVLNLSVGVALFTFQLTSFLVVKSSGLGRRIYQPKSYLVSDRLRVEAIPVNPIRWIRRIFAIKGEELKAKCGLDGYFAIRFLRAMIVIFLPLMVIIVVVLLPVNFNGGKDQRIFEIEGHDKQYNVTGLDTLSWQNVAPTQTNRYWAHLVCALLVIGWTLYRVYREKMHFVTVRQQYLTSPEHRLKASARTILVTNIPSEYQSEEKLKALFDVFVDNDDRSRLHVWVNRDYGPLRALVRRRQNLCHQLEKEELAILRLCNKKYLTTGRRHAPEKDSPQPSSDTAATGSSRELEKGDARRRNGAVANYDSADDEEGGRKLEKRIRKPNRGANGSQTHHLRRYDALSALNRRQHDPKFEKPADRRLANLVAAFKVDCTDDQQLWRKYLKSSYGAHVKILEQEDDSWTTVPSWKFWAGGHETVPKIAYLRAEIARTTLHIEDMLPDLDKDERFKRQNSAFVQFDRQMAANMACALVTHHKAGTMAPRYLHVAPHEIVWPNMGLTSLQRFFRKCIALVLFAAMVFLWAIPATFLGILSQLESLRQDVAYLSWLKPWPSYLISLISGPLTAILLALLIQLVVPALCRKLAVLVGSPTRSRREVVTQSFYFVFLFIELVLVTSISSGLIATIALIINNPVLIANTLATNLPKAANYFFNYLIIQALGFSGSVLFQYLRVLFITLIWPFHTHTPRKEVWLQTTIPHQMWANVFSMWTNFAAIGLIYSVIAPLMLIFISAVFCLFWIAYRHNYYYVQRNKVDTHGLLFEQAFSQLLAGIYVLEVTLIGMFFLVRDENNNVVCTPQAAIMIAALCLTAAYHFLLEQTLDPLRELIPVTLEDTAVDAEKRFLEDINTRQSADIVREEQAEDAAPGDQKDMATTAANARKTFSRLTKKIDARVPATVVAAVHSGTSKREVQDQLGASIARFPDELIDLTPEERHAELRAAYQDPVTREPQPVIWIPEDPAGVSEDSIEQSRKYGRVLRYSNVGAYLNKKGACEVTQLAPDVRSDWLLDWVL